MLKKNTLTRGIITIFLLLFPLFCTPVLHAQCAGDDAAFNHCAKEEGRFLNLFDALGGNPQPGGTWSDNDLDRGLNPTTGILDTYAIMTGGIFEYTYTVTGDEACTNPIAVVTLTLSSYPGRDNNNAVACADAGLVNLFQFSGSSPSPTIDGEWTAMNLPDGVLSGENNRFFDVSEVMPGRYDFMYTVPAYGDCPASSSNIVLEVAESPESGTFTQPIFCESDNLSNFTQYDLREVLVGEDAGGIWSETSATREITGPGDSRINIERLRNTLGPGTYSFTYTVNPVNPTCLSSSTTVNILIEEVIDFSATSFRVNLPDTLETVCEDNLPIQPTGTINVDTAQVADGDYTITYQVNNATTTNRETLTIAFAQGTADFPINPDFVTGAGEVSVSIVLIEDPNTESRCKVPLDDVSDSFMINALPDLRDTTIDVAEPICFGESLNIRLTDATEGTVELLDGTYAITYEITTQNSTKTANDSITVTDGIAAFTVASGLIDAPGSVTFSLTSVTAGSGCSVATSISDIFTISPRPDASSLSLSIPNTCIGEPITAILNSGVDNAIADGTYSLTYSITGVNTAEDIQIDMLAFSNGLTSFTIPEENLNPGISTLTITGLQQTETGCTATNLNTPEATFTIFSYPNLSQSDLNIASVCEAQPVNLTISEESATLPDGTYTLQYTLTRNQNSSSYSDTLTISNGNGTLALPGEAVITPGAYTFTLDNFANSAQNCPAIGLPRQTSFEIYENPDLNNATLAVASVCFGEQVVASLNNADVEDGDFTLTYSLEGANTIEQESVTAAFLNGTTSFTIPEESIQNAGDHTLNILSIAKQNDSLSCVTKTPLTTRFSINPQPVLEDVFLSLATAICLGDAASIAVTSANGNLTDGTYNLTYTLAGANSSASQTQEITITSGSGSFNVPAALLVNTGSTQLTVTRVTNATTGCNSDTTALFLSFDIVAPPNLTNATLTLDDFCAASGNPSVNVSAPNLTDGTYAFTYNLAGANTGTQTVTDVGFLNGNGSFELPESVFTNAGETTLTITAVSGASCRTENLSLATTFEVFALPQLDEQALAVQSVCLGENSLFSMNGSGLEDGNYVMTYSLSGANAQSEESITINSVNGSAEFIIAASTLSQPGTTTFTITSLQNSTTGCENRFTRATVFEIYPVPDLQPDKISAIDICFGEAGMLSFTNALGLANGTYTITYGLSGANTGTQNTATVTINEGNGIMDIPASQFSFTGTTTITVQEITSAAGCTSGTVAVSADFEVLPRPDAGGLSMNIADICLTSTAIVNLSGATNLPDGEYLITYQLGGSNTAEQMETLIFTSGEAQFSIAPSLLANAGNTTFRINQVQDFINQCSAANLGTNAANFTVNDPETPSLMNGGNSFCINDNPTAAALLKSISPSEGITIYTSETGDTVVAASARLVNGNTYYASQTNATGCESSQRLAIRVDLTQCDNIFIPEAFSPNGDGVNDRFVIENIDVVYPDYTIEIFNRNGNVVYKGRAGDPAWEGNANQHQLGNNTLPNGVYFYIINYNNGETAPKQGNLYLNR